MLAGLIHKVGLLAPQQQNLAGAALTAYKQSTELSHVDGSAQPSDDEETEAGPKSQDDRAAQFARIVSVRWPTVKFLGVWDTVASVIDLADCARRMLTHLRKNQLLSSGWSNSIGGRMRVEQSLLAESWNPHYATLGFDPDDEDPTFLKPAVGELAKSDGMD
jgi:hypothetical protein